MNHDHWTDGAVSIGALIVSAVTSDKVLIFLSIVLVVIRIRLALKGKP